MRWLRRITIGLAGLIVLALAVIYGGSALIIHRGYAATLPPITAARGATAVAEGHRVAQTVGCLSCHGEQGEGRVLDDVPLVGHIATTPIPEAIARYSDQEIARLVRYGVKRTGAPVFVMPISGHKHIADDDLARLIAFVRTLEPSPTHRTDRLSFGPLGRALLVAGAIKPEVDLTTVAPARRPVENPGGYLVASVCGGCHALREGRQAPDDGRPVPALAEIGPAYDLPAFRTLLRTGVGPSKRDLGLMTVVARGDLSHLTDAEIESIHAYLVAEGAKPATR